jgi:hypothetical protein
VCNIHLITDCFPLISDFVIINTKTRYLPLCAHIYLISVTLHKREENAILTPKRYTRAQECRLLTKMASADSSMQKLEGTWDYIDGENFDAYLQEMGKIGNNNSCLYLTKYFIFITEVFHGYYVKLQKL